MIKTVRHKKDPDAVLDYGFDWSKWLEDDAITESTWTVPIGLTSGSKAVLGGVQTVVWLSGGTAGSSYRVTNHIKTQHGREEDRSMIIDCIQR